jgi:lambda family phage tail tape measure protein
VTQAELDRQAAMNQRRASVGVENSLTQFMDDATNFAAMSEQVTTDFLGGMEDAWARFAATGKVSFKELASSMIDDLSRISFKLAMSGILDWLKGGVSSGGGGFLSTVASTLFGGGAAGHPLYGASGMVFDGGVIASPRSFRRGGRRAEAGENGPEGVLPLERTSDGRLGVLVAGGGGMGNVTVAPSFPINVHYHGNSQPEIGAAPDGRGGLDLIFKNIARSEASDVIEQTMPDYGAKKLRVRR